MTEAALIKRFHIRIPPDDGVSSDACREFEFRPAGRDLVVMTEDGRVTRLSAFGRSRVATPDGLHVGSTKADVQKVYGKRLKIEPNHYDEAQQYLTVWSPKTKRGIRFETDPKGVVSAIHVGGDAITYVEGCL